MFVLLCPQQYLLKYYLMFNVHFGFNGLMAHIDNGCMMYSSWKWWLHHQTPNNEIDQYRHFYRHKNCLTFNGIYNLLQTLMFDPHANTINNCFTYHFAEHYMRNALMASWITINFYDVVVWQMDFVPRKYLFSLILTIFADDFTKWKHLQFIMCWIFSWVFTIYWFDWKK